MTGYSASVRMTLHTPKGDFQPSQLGPDYVVLRGEFEIPGAMQGELVVWIDGKELRYAVDLPDGVRAGDVGEFGRLDTRCLYTRKQRVRNQSG